MKTNFSHIWNERGQSLVQVMISAAIMAILMLSFATMSVNQSKENRALSEKLAALDFQRTISQALTRSAVCSAMFTASNLVNSSSLPFNGAVITPSEPYTFAVHQLPSGGAAPALAVSDTQVSPLSNQLFLNPSAGGAPGIQIRVTNLSPPIGVLTINFDQTRLVRPIKGFEFPIHLTTTGPLGTTNLTGCVGSNAAAQVNVSVGTLSQFVPTAGIIGAGFDGTCNSILTSASLNFQFNSACSRFCTHGCSPPTCDTARAGLGYNVGFMTECNATSSSAQCSCAP